MAFNSPGSGRGYWLRYSMVAPTERAEPPYAQLWFMRSDRAATPRNRALRTNHPIADLAATSAPFSLQIGTQAHLDGEGCRGRLLTDHGEVEWDLDFEALLPPMVPTPEWGARIATCYTEPQPLLRVSGWIIEDGARTAIDGWLGEQAHVFGVRHSTRWHWAECKHLGAPGRAFTGVAAWPRLPGPPRSATSLYLELGGGRRLLRNRSLDLFRPHTSHSADGWHFDAQYRLERLVGSVVPDRDDLIGVTYHDPSGVPVYCYHSELADLTLDLYRRERPGLEWSLEESLRAPGACAFEYGSIEPLPGIPLLLD